jgi:uncharacterized protein (DUF4415 family)
MAKSKPNPELIDDENPEWTQADFARSRPAYEWFAERGLPVPKPRHRGPGRKPRKTLVSVRLSPDVLAGLRATGRGWQSRVDAALREWLANRPSS